MKKFSLIAAGLIAGVALNLNAAVVASVNGTNITDAQINEAFAPMLKGQKITSLPKDQQKYLIEQYIVQYLFLEQAKKENLENSSTFKKELERAKDGILLAVYQEDVLKSIKVSEAEAKKYYEKNKDKFFQPAKIKAKHILVKSEAEAKSIINELKNLKGNALETKFSEIAKTKSIDTGSAANGGELGWFDQSTMVKSFTDSAFSLKKGSITKNPIKTDFGYHVILKEDEQAKGVIPFDKIKNGIENTLRLEEFKVIMDKKAKELLSKAKVEIK